jgi:hypothetical protein
MTRRNLDAVQVEMLRANQTQEDTARPKDTQDSPHAKAARILNAALENSHRTADEAAFSLGVSASLVRRMASVDARETISLVQIGKLCLDLGPRFTYEFHKAFHLEHKCGRVALGEALQALSLVGVGIEP